MSMSQLAIPLTIENGRLQRTDAIEQSINAYLDLLVGTTRYLTAADPQFGFIFNNLKFENVNEHEGVVSNKKLSGSSKNMNTYAAELLQTINRYEKRLGDVKVNMTYIREEKQIYTTVTGTVLATQAPYEYTTTIKVWH